MTQKVCSGGARVLERQSARDLDRAHAGQREQHFSLGGIRRCDTLDTGDFAHSTSERQGIASLRVRLKATDRLGILPRSYFNLKIRETETPAIRRKLKIASKQPAN